MRRLMLALYHPRNEYVLHLEKEAGTAERIELARFVRLDPVISVAGNVHMVARANLVSYRGPTMTSTYLHCAAILLRQRKEWDWYINLSAADYPLIPQDDLLHVMSYLPRDLNFIEHTSGLGWKLAKRYKPILIDPGLISNKKENVIVTSLERPLPTNMRLFGGSAWVVLSRAFTEYCIWGWDNLPRIALMYYTNIASSPEGYFQTVICNSREFKNTTVNHDMHYIRWDNPPRQHPKQLDLTHFDSIMKEGIPFARKFPKDAEVLDKIDRIILNRGANRMTPGGWCAGSDSDGKDPCLTIGDPLELRPGPAAERTQHFLAWLLEPSFLRRKQCE
eukprot:SM000140S00605  [mRNA]  locus=s140:104566:107181:- [translate_table: standard]